SVGHQFHQQSARTFQPRVVQRCPSFESAAQLNETIAQSYAQKARRQSLHAPNTHEDCRVNVSGQMVQQMENSFELARVQTQHQQDQLQMQQRHQQLQQQQQQMQQQQLKQQQIQQHQLQQQQWQQQQHQ